VTLAVSQLATLRSGYEREDSDQVLRHRDGDNGGGANRRTRDACDRRAGLRGLRGPWATVLHRTPVPTIDEVYAALSELTDPNIPAANKTNIVTPGFTAEEAQTIDDHLNNMNARGFLPPNIVVTNMQPEPNNFAGATVAAYNGVKTTPPGPIVLVEQGGHWLDLPTTPRKPRWTRSGTTQTADSFPATRFSKWCSAS
jgi:hypothetical protein